MSQNGRSMKKGTKNKRVWRYMHTLHKQPASFDGRQICYGGYTSFPIKLLKSLAELRNEERESEIWREKQGHPNPPGRYGYVKVAL